MNSVIVFCLAFLLACDVGMSETLASAESGSSPHNNISSMASQNDFIIGAPSSRSVLLYSQHVFEFERNHTEFHWQGERIERIEALDQMNGIGGQVYEFRGGVAHDFVDIFFHSLNAEDRGINFVVKVYGTASDSSSHIIDGDLNERSFLIHSERVHDTHFSWENSSIISRFEIVDKSDLQHHRIQYSGGVNQQYLRFYVLDEGDVSRINFLVNIYTEPNDFELGHDIPTAKLAHTYRLRTSQSFATFEWHSPTPITRIVALDQTNGTGGFVNHITGLQTRLAYIEFINVDALIDYIISVYNVEQLPNDKIVGNLTAKSELLHTELITEDSQQASRFWSFRSDDLISMVEMLDQTNGTGARVDFDSIGRNDINVWFSVSGRLHFLMNVWGERSGVVKPNNIMLGQLSYESFAVDRKEVLEWRWSVATYVFESEHVLTRIEIRDLMAGHGGRGELIHGGIGNRTLVVLFTADAGQSIHFDVTVYAG